MIDIWQPRYKDKIVLIAKYKVTPGVNYIQFTKAKHLEGMVFSINATEIVRCAMEYIQSKSGTYTAMYAVPFDLLQRVNEP